MHFHVSLGELYDFSTFCLCSSSHSHSLFTHTHIKNWNSSSQTLSFFVLHFVFFSFSCFIVSACSLSLSLVAHQNTIFLYLSETNPFLEPHASNKWSKLVFLVFRIRFFYFNASLFEWKEIEKRKEQRSNIVSTFRSIEKRIKKKRNMQTNINVLKE